MIPENYLIEYHVTKTMEGNGEFSNNQTLERHTETSTTNDLNEIFTELFDRHRFDSIIGIEIIKVSKMESLKKQNEILNMCISLF